MDRILGLGFVFFDSNRLTEKGGTPDESAQFSMIRANMLRARPDLHPILSKYETTVYLDADVFIPLETLHKMIAVQSHTHV